MRAYVFVLALCDDNFKIDCKHILLLFSHKSGVCCFCPLKNQQNCLKFACYGQIKIEREVCVIACPPADRRLSVSLEIVARDCVTLCAGKVNDNVADFKLNFIERLTFKTIVEGKIKLIMFTDILTDSHSHVYIITAGSRY